MWTLSDLGWKKFTKRVWAKMAQDDVFGGAAKLAYYFLLALFPSLIFLTSAIGLILGPGTGMRHELFSYLGRVMPSSAFHLIDTTMWEISSASGAGKLSFGLLATLWAASNGMSAITQSLNAAYDLKETRPWWKQRVIALGLTIGLSVFIIVALMIVIAGGRIADAVVQTQHLPAGFSNMWKIVQWPLAVVFILLAFAFIYFFAPDAKRRSWKWITPGSLIGLALWLLASFAFKAYLHFFDSYSKTYGSLGAVIVLMLWLYLTGLAVLVGGEIDSEIKNVAAEAESRRA